MEIYMNIMSLTAVELGKRSTCSVAEGCADVRGS